MGRTISAELPEALGRLVAFRVTERTFARLRSDAAKRTLTVSDFIRELISVPDARGPADGNEVHHDR
jgi:hypothetical protein